MREMMSKANTRRMLVKLEEAYPDIRSSLVHETSFQLLVATMLVAQSTEDRVNAVTEQLFAKYPNPEDFASLSSDELHENIKELGLFRAKADHIIGASRLILKWYKGEVPRTQEELMRLPGIGRKTANLILAEFDIPALPIDPHVQRVANRIGITNSMNPEITEKQLGQRIAQHLWNKTQRMLAAHGRVVCTAKNPQCHICPVANVCQFQSLLQQDDKLRNKVFVETANESHNLPFQRLR